MHGTDKGCTNLSNVSTLHFGYFVSALSCAVLGQENSKTDKESLQWEQTGEKEFHTGNPMGAENWRKRRNENTRESLFFLLLTKHHCRFVKLKLLICCYQTLQKGKALLVKFGCPSITYTKRNF